MADLGVSKISPLADAFDWIFQSIQISIHTNHIFLEMKLPAERSKS